VLDRTAPNRYCVGLRVEVTLYGIANDFMLPRRMRLFTRRATAAGRSGLELLAGRAAIGIGVRLIDERLLPQAKGLGWRRVGLGHRRNDACLGAGAALLAVTLPLSFRLEVS